MPLHEPKELIKWCGPYVIASITGCTRAKADVLIQRQRHNRNPVTYTYPGEVRGALQKLGWRTCNGQHYQGRITLARWLEKRRDPTRLYLVMVTGHWLVVHGRRIGCSGVGVTNPEDYPRRRRRVSSVYIVTKE